MFVYEALNGRIWPDIPKEFLRREPDGFVLLTDGTLVAYLPAWLMCALDDMDGENVVRELSSSEPLTESLSVSDRCKHTTAVELFLAVNRSNPSASAFGVVGERFR